MLGVMAKPRRKKTNRTETPYVDVFSRIDLPVVEKLDGLADDQKRSRSAMVAWIVEDYIAREYPKLVSKRRGAK